MSTRNFVASTKSKPCSAAQLARSTSLDRQLAAADASLAQADDEEFCPLVAGVSAVARPRMLDVDGIVADEEGAALIGHPQAVGLTMRRR
jgi:hypothetical protein